MGRDTGFFSFTTERDGLCCYDTAEEAITEASESATRDGESVNIYTPDGELHAIVHPELPSHEERCIYPELHGFEDE